MAGEPFGDFNRRVARPVSSRCVVPTFLYSLPPCLEQNLLFVQKRSHGSALVACVNDDAAQPVRVWCAHIWVRMKPVLDPRVGVVVAVAGLERSILTILAVGVLSQVMGHNTNSHKQS